jgi:hypothetical protein
MGQILLLSLLAALNPTLLAATTVMLLLPHPGRLMLGYWLGGMLVSVTLGLVIVFALEGSTAVNTTKNTLSPAANFALAGLMWIMAGVLATGRDQRVRSARKSRKATADGEKEPPKWQQRLGKGTARTTFVVGGLLSLPGATYLVALNHLSKLNYPAAVTVLVVILFNLIQMLLIEVPMVALKVAPSRTPVLIENAKDWARIHGRGLATWALVILGLLFAIRGLIEILK